MDFDRIPGWLKALAASLWVLFVLAPLVAWTVQNYGNGAIAAAMPFTAAVFFVFHRRAADDDMSDAEYYRRKAAVKTEC